MVHKVKIRYQSDKQCPVCLSLETEVFFEAQQIPMRPDLLWKEREDAQSVPKGDFQLAFCERCGHIFNMAYNPDLVKYNRWYENSLHFSSRYQGYTRLMADRLMESYDLNRRDIVEIGGDSVNFLDLLCELGDNRGIGFDPGYPDDPGISAGRQRVTFVQGISSEQYTRYQADLICCRQILEQIFKPSDFVNMLRRAIGDKRETVGFFEVPNGLSVLRADSIWRTRYERYSYFSPTSLTFLFTNNGFQVIDHREEQEGSILTVDIRPCYETSSEGQLPEGPVLDALKQDVAEFNQFAANKINFWQDKLKEFKAAGKKVILWGAGVKGVNFLNMLKLGDEIQHVVDSDWRKRDLYVAGTGHRIVSPGLLRSLHPDTIIIVNPRYETDIRQHVSAMDMTAEVLIA